MPPSDTRDDTLMRAVAKGDEKAFTERVIRHRAWLYTLICAITQDEEQAKDLTQETLSRIHRAAPNYTPQGNFVAWAKRIAVNLSRNYLQQKRRATLASLSELEGEILYDESDPMLLFLSKGLKEEVRGAIQTLPDEQRLTVIMRYFGNMSIQDIAWAMHIPEGTVKSRLYHALRRVRTSLETLWITESDSLKESKPYLQENQKP